MLSPLINTTTLIIPILLAVAFLTLLERKLLGYIQLRKGPNITGVFGLLQPVADGVKLFAKEPLRPSASSPILFILTPTLALLLALLIWGPITLPTSLLEVNLGLLMILAISSLSVYTTLWSGWASNSKYALIGALRAIAQTISYEVSLGLIIISAVITTGGFNLKIFLTAQESAWLVTHTWPLMIIWYISTLAETNRAPFDLTEGESELVSGFNVEYAAGPFAIFFLAEYTQIILINTLSCLLFFCPTTANEALFTANVTLKSITLIIIFLWIRASYPRFRYDQLIHLLWKNFLPITLALCLWFSSIPFALAGIPTIS